VTAIEEAKDLITLSVEDLVSSLKVHEIGLNEHEPGKKVKSIALPSRGKSSKALIVVEFEDESPDGDSDEDPTEKMAMLSNKLEYLARKNKTFLSKKGGYRSSKKEDQKGCFNCKKIGHFIAECPDLQKEKSKDKSKKASFNTRKFRKQIKKNLMATWEDLDSESGSEKEEAEEEANVTARLVATVTSEAEPDSDSKDENEVYAKIPKEELIIKELLTHFEVKTNELIDLKEKYIVLIKQQESTLLDLKASEEGLRGFDFICRTYEEKLKYLVLKLQEKCSGKTLSEHEIALEDFIISGIDRSKVASMIYNIYKNNGKGIGFSDGKSKEISLKTCCECIKGGLKTFFVPEGAEPKIVVQLEPKASNSKAKITSKPKNSKFKAMINSEPGTSKIKIMKKAESVPQSLLKTESDVLKSKAQKNKTVVASWKPKPNGVKPEVSVNQKHSSSKHKVQEVKSKSSSTNPKGPIKKWVPKSKIVNAVDMPKGKRKAQVMVPGQWMLKAHDRREIYVPHPHNEGRRKCEVWRQPIWQDHWYGNYW